MKEIAYSDVDSLISSWALEQIAPWLLRSEPLADISLELVRLNATDPNVFLLAVSQGRATLIDKPEAARNWSYESALGRAQWYRGWLSEVAGEYCPDLCTTVAIFVGDGALLDPCVPVFSFQKPLGNCCLLLPDIDLLRFRFAIPEDKFSYFDKKCGAVFAGATSGGFVSPEGIRRDGGIPRIRAALFFRDKPDVSFKLPSVVQYEDDEAVEILRRLDVGVGEPVPWSEQLGLRFILSMDGNGATCSRVATALGSNSVLVKYDSPHVLYYFSGMVPWRHFVPISRHEDVLRIIDLEKKNPGFFQSIAEAGKEFSAAFLNATAAKKYTTELLRFYANLVSSMPPKIGGNSFARFEVSVHKQNLGDIQGSADDWIGVSGKGLAIEGFAIWPHDQVDSRDLQYQFLRSDGTLSAPVNGGYFCGTRGQSMPLKGLRVWLRGESVRLWRCLYSAKFTDGSEVGPLESGEVCQSSRGGYLEAIHITWLSKSVCVE